MSINKDFINKIIEEIKASIKIILEYSRDPFESLDDARKYSIRYHLIVIAEALSTLSIYLSRRLLKRIPETPLHAVHILMENKLVRGDEYRDIINIIKLRNLLVHRYWIINDEIIYSNIRRDFKNILAFINRVGNYVSKN